MGDILRKVLFVVLSGTEADTVNDRLGRTHLQSRKVVPDADEHGIRRRQVGRFDLGTDDVLVAAEMAIQRGYNILNAGDTAALGAVVYLTRSPIRPRSTWPSRSLWSAAWRWTICATHRIWSRWARPARSPIRRQAGHRPLHR